MFTVCNKQAKSGINSMDFAYLRQLVRQHSAVVLDADKEYLAELHIEPLAEKAGFDSISSLVAHLRTQPINDLHMQVVEALVTNETLFFRDIYPFEALKNSVLPELIAQRQVERSINIWCAACSSGQEPYSIAMLIREHFPMLASWKIQLIASDFSSKVLAKARNGDYNNLEIKRGLSPILREKYFHPQAHGWQIKPEIRQMIEFHQMNLIQPWLSLPAMDIIFLRNTLIYFDIDTKKAILKKVRQQLKPDGYLFLGGGETTINLDDTFERVQIDKSVCHRLPKTVD